MSNEVDLLNVVPGWIVQLTDGSRWKVTHNPRDGMWLYGRAPKNDEIETEHAQREMAIFAQDIERVFPESISD